MTEPVTVTRDGEIAIVAIDNPPVNALGQHLFACAVAHVNLRQVFFTEWRQRLGRPPPDRDGLCQRPHR